MSSSSSWICSTRSSEASQPSSAAACPSAVRRRFSAIARCRAPGSAPLWGRSADRGPQRSMPTSECGLRTAWPVKGGGLVGLSVCHESVDSVRGRHDLTSTRSRHRERREKHRDKLRTFPSDAFASKKASLQNNLAVPCIFRQKSCFFSLLALERRSCSRRVPTRTNERYTTRQRRRRDRGIQGHQ